MSNWIKRWSSIHQSQGKGPSWTIKQKIRQLMDIDDFAGTLIKIALLGGLEAEEILAIHRMHVCSNYPSWLCEKLHFLTPSTNIAFAIISDYFPTERSALILPFALWKKFRALNFLSEDDIGLADAACRLTGVNFGDLALIYEHVHSERSNLGFAISFNRISDSRKMKDEIELLVADYRSGWENYDVDLYFL